MQQCENELKNACEAVFGIDVKLRGMKYAAIMFTPVFRGKLKTYDAAVALARPGVHQVVEIFASETGPRLLSDDGIAVVADTWWQAQKALEAMPKAWDDGDNARTIRETARSAA